MIKSEFIFNIVQLMLDDPQVEPTLKKQASTLIDTEYEYTSAGLFVSFILENDDYILSNNKEKILDGIMIESPELTFGAQATMFILDGKIKSWLPDSLYKIRG